jgi:AcrR family transcriptional regulator
MLLESSVEPAMDGINRILTPEERRQRNHDEMRTHILDAARAVMREQGVAALNLQEVARRVGMRAPSLYNYFPSKLAIYEALFALGMRMYREQTEVSFAHYGATWEGIQDAIEVYMAFALENPELYQLVFERPVPGFVPSPAGLEEASKLLEMGRRYAAEVVDSGTLDPPISAEATLNLLIALMHGLTAQHLANEPHLPLGSGRFGSLIPVVIDLLRTAWGHNRHPEPS